MEVDLFPPSSGVAGKVQSENSELQTRVSILLQVAAGSCNKRQKPHTKNGVRLYYQSFYTDFCESQ